MYFPLKGVCNELPLCSRCTNVDVWPNRDSKLATLWYWTATDRVYSWKLSRDLCYDCRFPIDREPSPEEFAAFLRAYPW
jgi:hypothetical protein